MLTSVGETANKNGYTHRAFDLLRILMKRYTELRSLSQDVVKGVGLLADGWPEDFLLQI
jgi:hypothetical protein